MTKTTNKVVRVGLPERSFSVMQQCVYNAIMTGKSLIITWPYAAGKTYLTGQ